MSSAIAGVTPAQSQEATIQSTWPSLSARADGRMFGRLYEWDALRGVLPWGLTAGHFMAVATIPLIVPLYFFTLLPRVPFVIAGWKNSACIRYRITNRRILVEEPFSGVVQKAVDLDDFETIEIEQQPGQKWFHAGDLVFRKGQVETFRLAGVVRPEVFRHACVKAHMSHMGVAKARALGVVAG